MLAAHRPLQVSPLAPREEQIPAVCCLAGRAAGRSQGTRGAAAQAGSLCATCSASGPWGRSWPALPRTRDLLCGSMAGANEAPGLRVADNLCALADSKTSTCAENLSRNSFGCVFNKRRLRPANFLFVSPAPSNYSSSLPVPFCVLLLFSPCTLQGLQPCAPAGPVVSWELEMPRKLLQYDAPLTC